MHILLTNDDGILAPGLLALYRQLVTIADVSVVAPEAPQSASAHSITVSQALSASRVHVHDLFHGWSVDGRPADCVKLAIHELIRPKPDLVISGLNDGANVSINVLYSGTVAAAAEGALLGFPSIAVSMEHGSELNFDLAAMWARKIIQSIISQGLVPRQLLNINIPDLKPGRPKGVRVVPQATQTFTDYFERHEDPEGRTRYWLKGEFSQPGDVEGTDLRALWDGYIAVTPLFFDLTDRMSLLQATRWTWPGGVED